MKPLHLREIGGAGMLSVAIRRALSVLPDGFLASVRTNVTERKHDSSDHVLGPEGVMRAAVGLVLGAVLGVVIAVITPRRNQPYE